MRFYLLLLIGIITFIILMFANNPDLLNDVWMYIVGLSGVILKLIQTVRDKIKTFASDVQKTQKPEQEKAMG